MEKLTLIKKEIIRLLCLLDSSLWKNCEIIIQFPPFINKGFKTLPSFWDLKNERARLFLNYDNEFQYKFYSFIFIINQECHYNQIIFKSQQDDYDNSTIEISFNQEIEDTFQMSLPKSKKGKTSPWWKIDSETVGLGDI